jgi:hypothetical protein
MNPRWARPFFALTAACVLIGVVVQLIVSANDESVFGGSAAGRAFNIFAFFTVQSNVIVGVTSLMLASRVDRSSTVFKVFRLIGVVAITVTGIVFHVVLSGLLDLDTWAQVANQFLHTVVPILALVGWLTFGPRGLTSGFVVRWTVAFPLLYMVFTAVRGPLASDWYPYPFANVHDLGYLRVAVNALWITLLFIGLGAGANALDRVLVRARSRSVETADV